MLPLMRRLVSLQEYATILNTLSAPVSEPPDRMTEITEKLTSRLREIEKSVI